MAVAQGPIYRVGVTIGHDWLGIVGQRRRCWWEKAPIRHPGSQVNCSWVVTTSFPGSTPSPLLLYPLFRFPTRVLAIHLTHSDKLSSLTDPPSLQPRSQEPICLLGLHFGRLGPLLGQKCAFRAKTGPFGARPKCVVTMSHTCSDQPVAVGTKSGPQGCSRTSGAPKTGPFRTLAATKGPKPGQSVCSP